MQESEKGVKKGMRSINVFIYDHCTYVLKLIIVQYKYMCPIML